MATAELAMAQPNAQEGSGRTQQIAQLLSLVPLAMLAGVAADGDLARLSAGQAWLLGWTVAWMTLGSLMIRRSQSPLTQSIALLVFTIPATIAAVVVPWLALAVAPAA